MVKRCYNCYNTTNNNINNPSSYTTINVATPLSATNTPNTGSNQENFLLDSFLYVNGRRYHNVPTASYCLPNDKQEIERLTLEHIIYRFIWHGNFSSPVDDVLKSSFAKNDKAKVLDIGCGSGNWLLEMAEEYPNANFVGIDISPIFPNEYDSNKPTNVAFLKFDALKLIRITKPGGWIEIMDIDPFPYDAGPILNCFLESMSELLLSKGINRKIVFDIPLLFNQKSELITVHSQERPNPIGSWGGKMLKNVKLIVDSLKPYILPASGLSEQEFHEMIKSIYDELNTNKTFYKSYRHFAQKQY
ncbi:21559_t:CDS:2 [Entrophospora sp. SA101]|nr:14269_t:CDS:2 [Entrophospora sp. SA101]CAJ0925908.1 21559_t:CDS:2 [Entrophospora sp. SA101]